MIFNKQAIIGLMVGTIINGYLFDAEAALLIYTTLMVTFMGWEQAKWKQ